MTQPSPARTPAFFSQLEQEVNRRLRQAHTCLWSDPRRQSYFEPLFDRTDRGGFYSNIVHRVSGQTPTWSPHPAYIEFFEEIVAPAFVWLASIHHLEPALLENLIPVRKNWRDLFYVSPEYEDPHIRIFIGQLMDTKTETMICSFTMSAAHSFERFSMAVPRFQTAYVLDPLP